MTYCSRVTSRESAAIRKALKAAFPEFRFGVVLSDYGDMVHVRIMSGPVDLVSLIDHPRTNGRSLNTKISRNVKQVDFDLFKSYYGYTHMVHLTASQVEQHQDLFNAIIEVIQKSYSSNMPDCEKDGDMIRYTLEIGTCFRPYQIRYPRKGIYHVPTSYMEQARTALATTELA